MRKFLSIILVLCLAGGLFVSGCGPVKADSSQQAIANAKTMGTVQEKTDYLVAQAKAFYNSKQFQGAVDIAQYVLTYLDRDSQAAKSLLEKAKADLTAQMKQSAEDLRKTFGG